MLRNEKGFKNPTDIEKYLTFADKGQIANWARTDISLATRESIVTKWSDNTFRPQLTMTRGEAAIILKRLFDRIY